MLKHISARSPRNKLFSILSTFVFADSFDEENSDDSDTTFRPPMRRKKMDFDDSSNEENSDDNETSFRLPMRRKKMDFDDFSNEENSDDNETSFRLPMRQKKWILMILPNAIAETSSHQTSVMISLIH